MRVNHHARQNAGPAAKTRAIQAPSRVVKCTQVCMQIFLSHAQRDEAFAEALSAQLKARGFSVWSSAGEVLPGDNIWLRTGEALKKSKAMVILLSPDSMRSENVRREIEYALGDSRYEGRVFPVRLRPTDEVPWILRKFKTFDAAQSVAKVSDSIAQALKQVA